MPLKVTRVVRTRQKRKTRRGRTKVLNLGLLVNSVAPNYLERTNNNVKSGVGAAQIKESPNLRCIFILKKTAGSRRVMLSIIATRAMRMQRKYALLYLISKNIHIYHLSSANGERK